VRKKQRIEMSDNHDGHWVRRFLGDGIKSIKAVIGIGLAFALGLGEPLVGVLFLAWVLADYTLDRE
jgi:hypothetical protein